MIKKGKLKKKQQQKGYIDGIISIIYLTRFINKKKIIMIKT